MRLIDYIEESREVVGKLPFDLDLFTQYAKCRIFGSSNSDPFYEMFGIIKRSFTNNAVVWDCLNGYIDVLGKLKHIRQSDIENLYHALEQTPLDRLDRLRGAGMQGVVLDFDDKRVVKIYYKPMDDMDYRFYRSCMKNEYKTLPRVYKLGAQYVVMEKLDTDTKAIETFYKKFTRTRVYKGKTVEEWCLIGEEPEGVSQDIIDLYNWGITCINEYASLGEDYADSIRTSTIMPGDFSIKNIGRRSNGDIVWFDV